LYRGEQFDTDLGLYYLRARYYNPQTGRFLSRDPEEGNSGEPKKLHKYLYAYGNPVNRLDPTGRASIGEFLGIVEDFLNNILINLEITTVPRIGAWRVLGAVGGLVGLAASVSKNIYCLGEELNDLINSVPQTPEKALACHEDEDEGGENE
jgi:RHS repeat-associated protein